MTSRWLRMTRLMMTTLLTGTLIACGGSGGGTGSGGFLGDSSSTTLDAVISIELTDSEGSPSNQITSDSSLTATITLTKKGGEPIADAVVELSTTVGSVSPTNGSALTNSDGIATFEVTYDGTEGAGTVTASYSNSGNSVEVDIGVQAISATSVYLLDLLTTDSEGVETNRLPASESLTITVILYSVEGDVLTPISDEIVSLEASIGVIDPSNGSGLTNADGEAVFRLNADAESGAGVLTASYEDSFGGSLSRSKNIEVTAEDVLALSLKLELLNGASNPTSELTADEPVTARVTLATSSEGVSVNSRIVSLSSDIATVLPENGKTLTDASGIGEFSLEFNGTLGAGTVTASFGTDETSLSKTTVLEATSLALENELTLVLQDSAGNVSNTLTAESPLTARVTITDKEGATKDIDDEIIKLSSSIGAISPENGSALTTNGTAEFTLRFDDKAGAGVVTATYDTDQGALQKTANIEAQTPGEDNYVLTMSRTSGSVTPSNPVTVTVKLRAGSATGPVVPDALISLSSDISDISPSNGSVITNGSGNASFILQFNGTDGAGVVQASYTSEQGVTFTNKLNVTASRGTAGYSVDVLEASGTTFNQTGKDIRAEVLSGSGVARDVVVNLSSTVGIIEPTNKQALTGPTGIATFRLIGDGGTGAGTVTASVTDADGNVVSDSISVYMFSDVTAGGPTKLTFVSASPTTIALKGSGGGSGISEQSTVTFKLTDSSDKPVAGQTINFTLSTDLGGVCLEAGSNQCGATSSATTSSDGSVTAQVTAGTLPTPVRVIASYSDLEVTSDTLTVSSGVPAASRFSIYVASTQGSCTATPANPGDCTKLEIQAFDRFGNPAIDGTVVQVTTNCGGVGLDGQSSGTGSCELGVEGFGRCAVTWVAPEDWNQGSRSCTAGVGRVLAYAIGEESFTDTDGDAYFSAGDLHVEEDEPYLDSNSNSAHNDGEFFVDWNENGQRDTPNTSITPLPTGQAPAGSLYNGTGCVADQGATPPTISTPSAETDSCTSQLIYVWDDVLIIPTP